MKQLNRREFLRLATLGVIASGGAIAGIAIEKKPESITEKVSFKITATPKINKV
jgi:hypothetical protein